MFAVLEPNLGRRFLAACVFVLGVCLVLMLLPAMWIVSQVLTQPNHARFLWAGPAFLLDFCLLLLSVRLARAGWKHAK